MKYFAYSLMVLLVVGAMVTGGTVMSMQHDGHQGMSNWQNDQNDTGHNDTGHNYTHNATAVKTASGGGWFMANNSAGAMFKDNFGFFLNGNSGMLNKSSLVFHAREIGATVRAVEFDKVSLDNTTVAGHWTAKAVGKATGAGKLWNFSLQVTDMGKGTMDRFMLVVKNGTTTLTWNVTALGGGNISIPATDQNCEDQNDQDDHDEGNDTEPIHQQFMGALGAGTFPVKNATGVQFNDTFAFFLDARQGFYNNSALFFFARDAGLMFTAVEFDKVWLDNTTVPGHWTAIASGMAVADGKNWTFRLQAADMARNGTMDLFSLSVANGTQTMTWGAAGLVHGNIIVIPLLEIRDMREQSDLGSGEHTHADSEC